MLLVADSETAQVDPLLQIPTLSIICICNVKDPVTGQAYSRDPRYIAQKAEKFLQNTGRQVGPNLGYKIRHKEGYFPLPPADTLQDIRSEMILRT
jgi:glutamine synthetase